MIKNLEGTADHISGWIKQKAREAHAKALVVGISGGVDSALVAALCKRTGLPTVGVMMPCHSSHDSSSRAKEVIQKFGLTSHEVKLDGAFEVISSQVGVKLDPKSVAGKAAHGALRSCLRAPTLDYVGKIYSGLIVGTGNKSEDSSLRYYQKRGDGCVDISPIAQLYKSEVNELSKYLGIPASILNAVPSADLWGPDAGQTDESQLGMTYQEVEWGIRAAENHGGCYKEHFQKAKSSLPNLTHRQLKILEIIGEMELASRHKENPALPVCDVRSKPGLVE